MSTPQPDHAALLKRALVAIDQLEAKVAAAERARSEPIAVVGIGCRLPGGANDPEALWRTLIDGVDTVTEVPGDRWDIDAYYDPDPDAIGKTYTRWGAFLEGIDQFDAQFFGISPREAVMMDPQQRLLLEVTWQALEHAGIPPTRLAGSDAAVYVGITTNDYMLYIADSGHMHEMDAYSSSGAAHSMAAGRVSYVLGLHGPNVPIDTACSSSLVAMHWAVQSLRNGEASVALAGGVNLTIIPHGSILTGRARMMSFTGRCKTFDGSADGYVRSEGVGMLVLKRLADAQRDGDRILGLIRGSAVNQDGRSSGLTAPNGKAQVACIRAALANAGLKPADIGYIEAHGTGTSLGDPIEMTALGEVFRDRGGAGPLMVGSIKTNIGHTEATAGVAGMIKALLVLRNATVPPHLHLKSPNPMIPWDQLPVNVPTVATPWRSSGAPRRAGVSSFGFSGTNAHVVLEEAPPVAAREEPDDGPMQLLAFGAEGVAALRALAERYAAILEAPGGPSLRAVARTAAVGRSPLTERVAVVAASKAEAVTRLRAVAAGESGEGIARGTASSGVAPEAVFMFTGQGAQSPGMGMGLYEAEPVYRAAIDECARLLAPHMDKPLLELLRGTDPAGLDDTRYTQPALFAVEYALAQLWRSRGVEPHAVLGHSVGEFVAACVAGLFSLEDGLRLIANRARLMASLPRDGGMAAVFVDEARARAAIAGEPRLAIAGINGAKNTVISGETNALERVLAKLAAEGVDTQRLKVSHAFHSPLMDPILDEFEAIAAKVRFEAPRLEIVSNVTGKAAGAEIRTAAYWRRHLREAVRFADSLATLAREGFKVFVEVGPHPVLAGMAQREEAMAGTALIASLRRGRDDVACMLEALAQLQVRGQPLPVDILWGARAREGRVDLPYYPFQRRRYWVDFPSVRAGASLAATRSGHPLLGGVVPSPLPIYQVELNLARDAWLADHRIFDFTPMPAAAFFELSMAAARETLARDNVAVRDLVILEALMLPVEGSVTVQVLLTPSGGDAYGAQIFSRETAEMPWRSHARATVEAVPESRPAPQVPRVDKPGAIAIAAIDYYATLGALGQNYGPAFRGIAEIVMAPGEVLGRIDLPASVAGDAARMLVHPALMDGCLQLMGVPLLGGVDPNNVSASVDRCLPVGLERYRVHRGGFASAWCRVKMVESGDPDVLRSDMVLFDDAGAVLAELEGVEMRRITREALARATASRQRDDSWCLEAQWQGVGLDAATAAATDGHWLVLGEGGKVGAALGERLRAKGAKVTRVHAVEGAAYARKGDLVTIDAADRAHWKRVLEEAGTPQGVVSLFALEAAGLDPAKAIDRELPAALARVLHMAQALAEANVRTWIVTRGAQAVAGSIADPVQAAVWGLGNVIESELPGLRCTRVDLDPAAPADEAQRLADTLAHPDEERRVAWRGPSRLVARLRTHALAPGGPEKNLRLVIPQRGSLANLARQEVPREAPKKDEVEIRIHATGLNFRDVLNALGMYPGDPGPLGNECSGVVSAVGEGVTDLAVGDEVVCMSDRSFATWVTLRAVMCVKKPANLSFEGAATIPVTFLTADYALNTLGRMKKGTRVLIHAVTGGVGMAAAQLCRLAGAEVFGTASAGKRELAKTLADHVSDSRSLAFVEDFRKATKGEGVDIVLNSLAGDFIPASLGLMREGGRFVEIGKSDDWDKEKVAKLHPTIEYTRLYLGEVTEQDPIAMRERLRFIVGEISAGRLAALPQRVYPIERAEEAFRYMGQGLHVGKVVITQLAPAPIRGDATYLVTGGLGGLGLATAQWLAASGARHLVLMGRRAPQDEAAAAIERLKSEGVEVHVARADVADEKQLSEVLQHVEAHMPALRGVLHVAGSVDDGMLVELDMPRFETVMAPKVRGTWNLHRLTAARPLDFFVTFSSGAALLGSPGQGNYAAANAFMDGLAHLRRSQGRHALSINWGSWSGVGMAARVDEQHRRRWAAMGLKMIEPEQGVRMLEEMLRGSQAPQLAALPLVRANLPAQLGPFLAELRPAATAARAAPTASAPVDMRRAVSQAAPAARAGVLEAYLADQLVKVLALGAGTQVDLQRSVMEMGLDSLMAMELRNRIHGSVGVRVAVADLLRGPSIAQLAAQILAEVKLGDEAPATAAAPEAAMEEGSI